MILRHLYVKMGGKFGDGIWTVGRNEEVISVVSERDGVAVQSTDGKVSVPCMLALHRDSDLGIIVTVELSHFKGWWL